MHELEREGWRQYKLWVGFDIDRLERIISRATGVQIPEPKTKYGKQSFGIKTVAMASIRGASVTTTARKPVHG